MMHEKYIHSTQKIFNFLLYVKRIFLTKIKIWNMLLVYLILVISINFLCINNCIFFLPMFWTKYSMYVYLFCSRFSRLGRAHFKTCHRFSVRSDFDLTIAFHLDVHLFCFWATIVFGINFFASFSSVFN